MSGLAAVLGGHTPPGVYRWHAAFDADDVRHAVEHAGWRFAYADGWGLSTKEETLTLLGSALDFPDYFGRNLDALVDCLRDLGTGPGTVLLWDGWGPVAHADPATFAAIVEILQERSADANPTALCVLLRGEGPDLDVPSVD